MRRKGMFSMGKTRGVVSMRRRRPFQLMVLRKLRELKKIVPDAQEADIDALLQRTAEYICVLELRVTALRTLSALYGA